MIPNPQQEKALKRLAANIKRQEGIEVDISLYGPLVQALALYIVKLEQRIDELEYAERARKSDDDGGRPGQYWDREG